MKSRCKRFIDILLMSEVMNKIVILLIFCLVSQYCLCKQPSFCGADDFDQYLAYFEIKGVDKNDPYVYNLRKNIYLSTCATITQLSRDTTGATFHINNRAHLLDSQKVPKSLPIPIVTSSGHPRVASSNIVGAGSIQAKNWKTDGFVSSVKDQGSCGSCWVFATTAAYESGLMRSKGTKTEDDLSEEYVLECTQQYSSSFSPASTCAGGIVPHAFETIANTGMPDDSTYPYQGSTYGSVSSVPSLISDCFGSSSSYKKMTFLNGSTPGVDSYYDLSNLEVNDLIVKGTVVALIYADTGFMNVGSGVYACPTNSSESKALINHAVEIVGMDSNGNYIIKNSWSTSWGEDGFATVDAVNDCALSAYVYQVLGGVHLLLIAALSAVFALIL